MENLAIVAIAYNRMHSLERLLSSLLRANLKDTPLVISIDKSDTSEVEDFADSFVWPYGNKEVVKHKNRLGLREHILSVGSLLNKYEALIVLEDDIVVSPNFYDFAASAWNIYKYDSHVAGISLYNYQFNYQTFEPFEALKNGYDAYFMQIAMSWGQVWMRDSWNEFYKWYEENKNLDLQNIEGTYCFKDWGKNSWLKFHIAYCIAKNKYFVYPYDSYTTNCADKGDHVQSNLFVYQTSLFWGSKNNKEYSFPTFDGGVVYDSYNENELIYSILNIKKSELTLDLSDNNKELFKKRYLLTTKKLNFRIVKSYNLQYHPIELNIILDSKGEGIYLYDTKNKQVNRCSTRFQHLKLVSYRYRMHSLLAILRKVGSGELISSIFYGIHRKFSK